MLCEKTTVLRPVFPLRRPPWPDALYKLFALKERLVTKWIYRKRKVVIKWIQLYPTYNYCCGFMIFSLLALDGQAPRRWRWPLAAANIRWSTSTSRLLCNNRNFRCIRNGNIQNHWDLFQLLAINAKEPTNFRGWTALCRIKGLFLIVTDKSSLLEEFPPPDS